MGRMTIWELIYCGSGLMVGSSLSFLLYAILRVGGDADSCLDWTIKDENEG